MLLDASGIALSEAGAALLHQRTEGWAAGLRLAAISLAGHPDPERFVAEFSGSDRTVAEYLIAEMLERQPADVQDLLLRTSLLDRVNGELADLLTGRPGSERILLELEDANAFVVSLDPGRDVVPLPPPVRGSAPAGAAPDAARGRAGAAPARRRMVHPAGPGGRRHPAHPGGGRLARCGPAARRPFVQPDARRASADHAGAGAGLPAGRGSPRAGPGARTGDLVQGRLDEAAAHLAVAETYAETAPPDRQRRLRVAIASLKLSLARRRGHLAGVIEQARFLASPVTGQSDEDIALGQRPARGGADEPGDRRGVDARASRTPNDTSRRAPSWPGRSAGPTSKSAAWRSSGSRRRSTRSPPPSGAAVRR